MRLRTCVTFKSNAFNITNPKPEFVHPENFGDDVVRWFMTKFRNRQIAVDDEDPSQEDHGWYMTFRFNDLLYDVVVSYAPTNDAARWLVALERSVGLFGSIIGQRHHGVRVEAVRLVHDILQASEECRDVQWLFFENVRRGNLESGSADPLEP
jgi:hypothetical protein